LEVEHHAHDAGAVARHAQRLDVGVFDGDLALQVGEGAGELVGLELEHQPVGILDGEERVLERFFRLERETGVFRRRPDARGDDVGLRATYAGKRKEESQACPAGVFAESDATRPGGANSMRSSRSGTPSAGPTRSGHSTRQPACGLKYSRKPELSHSSAFFSL